MKPLKVTVDKYVFNDLVIGLSIWNNNLKNPHHNPDFTAPLYCAYQLSFDLCNKISLALRNNTNAKIKLNAAEALAFRHLLNWVNHNSDPWSYAQLVELTDNVSRHCRALIQSILVPKADLSGELTPENLKHLT